VAAEFGYSNSESILHAPASKEALKKVSGMKYFERFVQELSSWPDVSTHPHRFGGTEFRFNAAEIGHIHTDGTVDIPFPRAVRDALLAEGRAQQHHWVPNSGWITLQIRGEDDFKQALWLMRLSYLRYALKTASDPRRRLDEQSKELLLSPQLKSLFQPFLQRSAAA
jgi:hypothetical protein